MISLAHVVEAACILYIVLCCHFHVISMRATTSAPVETVIDCAHF